MEHSPQALAKKLIPTKQCTTSLANYSPKQESENYAFCINNYS